MHAVTGGADIRGTEVVVQKKLHLVVRMNHETDVSACVQTETAAVTQTEVVDGGLRIARVAGQEFAAYAPTGAERVRPEHAGIQAHHAQ